MKPFIGSGTTARVCQQLGRNVIGFDNNPEYIELVNERLSMLFSRFDSVDARMYRVLNVLNDPEYRKQYIQNHINCF